MSTCPQAAGREEKEMKAGLVSCVTFSTIPSLLHGELHLECLLTAPGFIISGHKYGEFSLDDTSTSDSDEDIIDVNYRRPKRGAPRLEKKHPAIFGPNLYGPGSSSTAQPTSATSPINNKSVSTWNDPHHGSVSGCQVDENIADNGQEEMVAESPNFANEEVRHGDEDDNFSDDEDTEGDYECRYYAPTDFNRHFFIAPSEESDYFDRRKCYTVPYIIL